jgi:hypothetical protein
MMSRNKYEKIVLVILGLGEWARLEAVQRRDAECAKNEADALVPR